jgi:hypothetical protein
MNRKIPLQLFQELQSRTAAAPPSSLEQQGAPTAAASAPNDRGSLHDELRSKVKKQSSVAMYSGIYERNIVALAGGHTNKSELSFSQRCSNLEVQLVEQNQKNNADAPPIIDCFVYDAISQQDWDTSLMLLRANPELARYQHHRGGLFPLHLACSRGSTPQDVIQALVEAYPTAVNCATNSKLCDTPLHMQSRNSQRTSSKAKSMLPYANVRITNRLGHTALHTACGSIAMIDVLEALIDHDPSLLQTNDVYGQTPLIALWESFLQSIPGHLAVAWILKDDSGEVPQLSKSFSRFWEKVKLLVFRGSGYSSDLLLGHGMLEVGAPTKMLQVAMNLHSGLTVQSDDRGNHFLHKMIICRHPFEKSLFQIAVTSVVDLPSRNRMGDTILNLSIRYGMVGYLSPLLNAAPELILEVDQHTGLYPFQLAATQDLSVEAIFSLLVKQPDILQY